MSGSDLDYDSDSFCLIFIGVPDNSHKRGCMSCTCVVKSRSRETPRLHVGHCPSLPHKHSYECTHTYKHTII